MKSLTWIAALVTSAFIVGCGGSGNAGSPPFPPIPCDPTVAGSSCDSTAKTIDVIASSVEVGSGGDTVTISAVVKDSGNVGLAGASIVFTANSGNLTQASATTNASGVATVTFAAGSNRANRTATITAKSGTKASGSIDIDIVGTKLEYQGTTTVPLGSAPVTVSIKATDSKGAIVPNLPITVTSSLGNTLSSASLTTDTQGTASLDYAAVNAGTDSLVFSGGGASKTASILISASQFVFVSPAPSTSVPVNTSQTVTVEYKIAGTPQAGKLINFSTTSGVVTPSATTDGAGRASAIILASTAGPGTVQATVQGAAAQASLLLSFVSLAPAHLVLQVSPTAIGPNAAGSTTQQAQLRATVTDVNANPVANAIVAFTRMQDPSGGNLSQPSSVTDSSGQATVQYISGSGTTADGGIKLRASVLTDPTVFGDAAMTVTQSALFIALGTGNTITNVDPQTYQKDWVVSVTDSNGVAVANKDLTIKVLPVEYRKGHLIFDTVWTYDTATLHTCANEDTDYTGTVTPSKDVDGSGNLQPGNVIRVTTTQTPNAAASGIARTDSAGQATISLLYAESFVPWVKVRLTAQATVSGTESSTAQEFYVPGLAADFSSASIAPAGVVSPFGVNPCTVPN
jgi:Bacterial Ig-like domain (group 1)